MTPCICQEALRHSFTSAQDVVMGNQYDAIVAKSEQLARDAKKEMSIYRCRVCGTLWAEGLYDRGQVLFDYLFPVPPTDDPVRWLNEQAVELPAS